MRDPRYQASVLAHERVPLNVSSLPCAMTTYVYETIPQKAGAAPRRVEVRQSMLDAPLTQHPESGEPVRRVIAGGFGFIAQKSAPPAGPCGGQCACFGNN